MKKAAVILLTALMIFHVSQAQSASTDANGNRAGELLSQSGYDSSKSVIPSYHFNPSFVKDIHARLEDEDLQIIPSENPFVKVDILATQPEAVPFYEVKNGALAVKSSGKKAGGVTIKVYIPKNHALQGIYIQTKRGTVSLLKQSAKKIDLETDRGNITINGTDSKKLYAKTNHGTVTVLNAKSDYARLESSRHDLTINRLKTSELSLETASADIKAYRIQTEKLSAYSSTGNITLEFAGPISKNSSAYTKKGSITIFKPENSWCRYITSSKYGKYDNDFDASDSNIKFSVESKTGNVSIVKK